MTKSEARAELKRANLAASGNTSAPGFAEAAAAELALFYAPGQWDRRLSDSELDARQERRLANLLETAANGVD